MRLLLLLLLCAASSRAVGGSSLQLVYAINRHGARNALSKTALLQEPSPGGVTLLPTGQRQCFDAGAAFRSRYLDVSCGAGGAVAPSNTCLQPATGAPSGLYGVAGAANVSWSNANVRVVSSTLDRTLLSARAFLEGVFPAQNVPTASAYLPSGAQPVPVFSVAGADTDDAFVRAYTKCPVYEARLLSWYNSPAFAAKEAASAPLRSYVGSLLNQTLYDTSLRSWWNVYDAFNVWRSGAGDPMPSVNASVWADMVALAGWLETSKMASALTGPALGGPIIADMLDRMLLAADDENVDRQRLVVVSGHYNTQLGILGGLYLDNMTASQTAAVPWLTRIPATAAVLAFELHRSDGSFGNATFAARLVAQDGPAANYSVFPLPCASAAGAAIAGEGACLLRDLVVAALPTAVAAGGGTMWCDACKNTDAAPCVMAANAITKALATRAEIRHHRIERTADVGVGVGIGLGLPLAALAARFAWLRVRRRRASQAAGRPGDVALPSALAVWPHHRLEDDG